MYKLLISMFWLKYLFNKAISVQNKTGGTFLSMPKKMKAFIGVKYAMVVNQLPSIPMYWDRDHLVGNIDIQNIFARIKYQVLQNLHFADTQKKTKQIKPIQLVESSVT